ncbi:hypothetical protein Y032_0057g2730 [Ancylostoma ceylanicum]|uniref:Uncharacterized protein n=1 Tax=Ancylostoma ceylanicum TaxID=53326 RepID=A0A016U649_9BILA|nr:hypothetical protein Y032_0057g2730 [Ancylostoma ceylanicum]
MSQLQEPRPELFCLIMTHTCSVPPARLTVHFSREKAAGERGTTRRAVAGASCAIRLHPVLFGGYRSPPFFISSLLFETTRCKSSAYLLRCSPSCVHP